MNYRELGKTGLKISEIGYGGEHLEGKPFALVDAAINTALDGGVNIIDIFMPQPEVRSNIGRAIGRRRKDVYIQAHIGSTIQNDGQYERSRAPERCAAFVEDYLTRLNTDYLDFGLIHYVDTEADYREAFHSPYIEYVQKLKKDGIVRFLGASTHDAAIGMKMVNTGLIDMIMFSINPVFDLSFGAYKLEMLWEGVQLDKLQPDPTRIEFYNLGAARGIGITVMKTLGAGRLLSADSSGLGHALTLPQCVAYALDRPAVASALLGCGSVEEVRRALEYHSTTPAERDYTGITQRGLPLLAGRCMYCNHCLPCPQGIDIAAVTKCLDMAKFADKTAARERYGALAARGGDCIACGSCERNCPFNVRASENMREAARIFGQ